MFFDGLGDLLDDVCGFVIGFDGDLGGCAVEIPDARSDFVDGVGRLIVGLNSDFGGGAVECSGGFGERLDVFLALDRRR